MRFQIFTAATILFFLFFCTSCYKDHLYVQQEWVDRNFLASSRVGTPDRRQKNPPTGQRLLVGWRFPLNRVCEGLKILLTVRFWDNLEEVLVHPIDSSKGTVAFPFFDRKILTYQIQVVSGSGEVIETWEHQFWTKLIKM